jgi:IPT/TIG domain
MMGYHIYAEAARQAAGAQIAFTPESPPASAHAERVHQRLGVTSGGESERWPGTTSTSHRGLQPCLSRLAARRARSTAGTTATVTGTNFTGLTKVLFGAVAATSLTVVSATEITAVSPAQAAVHGIYVATPAGTSASVKADQFTYS